MGDSLAVAAKDAYTAYDFSAFVFRTNVFLFNAVIVLNFCNPAIHG